MRVACVYFQSRSDPQKFLDFYRKYAHQLKEGVLDDVHRGSKYKDNLLKLLRLVRQRVCSDHRGGTQARACAPGDANL